MIRAAVILMLLVGGQVPVALAQGESGWAPCQAGALENAMTQYKELIGKERAWRMDIAMTSFPDPDAAAADHSTSVITCSGGLFKAIQLGFETYQNAAICAVADPNDRVVVLSEPKLPVDLMIPQRVSTLLTGSERTSCRTDAKGSEFRIMYAEGAGPYQHIDVYYDAVGYLSRIILQWRPTTYGEGPAPLGSVHSPRIEIVPGHPHAISKQESTDLVNGLQERLDMSNGSYTTMGAWKGYKVIDTRYRP